MIVEQLADEPEPLPRGALLIDCCARPAQVTDHSYAQNSPEPLGLEYIEAFLHDRGFDARVEKWAQRFDWWTQVAPPSVVGISGLTADWSQMLNAARAARRRWPRTTIVAGREHAALVPEEVLRTGLFDGVGIGSGELAVASLLEGSPVAEAPGMAWLDAAGRLVANRRAPTPRLAPGRRLRRRGAWMRPAYPEVAALDDFQAGVVWSRGCSLRCSFCTATAMWGGYEEGDAEWIARELDHLVQAHGVRSVVFHDLLLNASRSALQTLLTRLRARAEPMTAYGMVTAGPCADLLPAMKGCGFDLLGVGIEIPSDRRKAVGKGLPWSRCRSYIEAMSAAGIFVRAFVIIGWPWETSGDELVSGALTALRGVPINALRVHFLTPFPGTPTFEQYRGALPFSDLTANYSRFNTMEPLLRFHISPAELSWARNEILRGFYDQRETRAMLRAQRHDGRRARLNDAFVDLVLPSAGSDEPRLSAAV